MELPANSVGFVMQARCLATNRTHYIWGLGWLQATTGSVSKENRSLGRWSEIARTLKVDALEIDGAAPHPRNPMFDAAASALALYLRGFQRHLPCRAAQGKDIW
jgi:hypothetical protein